MDENGIVYVVRVSFLRDVNPHLVVKGVFVDQRKAMDKAKAYALHTDTDWVDVAVYPADGGEICYCLPVK